MITKEQVDSWDAAVKAAQLSFDAGAKSAGGERIIGTKTWMEDGKLITQNLTASEIYKPVESAVGEPVRGYYFPLTNETMQFTIKKLIAHAKRARWTNAIVRKDGIETVYEADWIKELVPFATPPAEKREPLTIEELCELLELLDPENTGADMKLLIELARKARYGIGVKK